MNSAASLTPGTGRIDLLGYATLSRLGAALDYQQRLARTPLSTFAQAWAGAARQGEEDRWRPDAGILGGVRWTF